MSSDYPDYGAVLAKNVKLDQTGLIFHDSSDDSKTVTLKLASGSLSAGNVDLTLPLTATALGGGGTTIPDGDSAGDALLWSGSAWVQKAVSGDATIDSNGALTIANNAIESGMIATGAVSEAKLATDSVSSDKIASGAVVEAKIASNAVSTAKIADDAITNAKLATNCVNADSCGITTSGVAEASKACVLDAQKDLTGLREFGCAEVQVNTKWKMKQEGNNLIFQYWTGSAWVTKQTFTPA